MKQTLSLILVFALLFAAAPAAHAATLSAKSAVLLDALTGAVLFEKDACTKRPMASTTKIMTAILVLESMDLESLYTVTAADAAVEGSALGIRAGDEISIAALLHGLLLVSGNDAAEALATACAGNKSAFVARMNDKAKQLGLRNTHFANPSGLSQKGHYSTAYDMAVLTRYALTVDGFERICSIVDESVQVHAPRRTLYLHNHNRLLSEYKGCIGVKTGYTRAAGRCLVSAARRNGQTLISVSLAAPDDWEDHRQLLDFGFAHAKAYVPAFAVHSIPVVGGNTQKADFIYDGALFYLPASEADKIETCIYAPHFLYAPVRQGQKVGEGVAVYRGKPIGRFNLYAASSVERYQNGKHKTIWQIWQSEFKNIWRITE